MTKQQPPSSPDGETVKGLLLQSMWSPPSGPVNWTPETQAAVHERAEQLTDAILSLLPSPDPMGRLIRAARALLDNIYEFETVTDGEFLDDVEKALAALTDTRGSGLPPPPAVEEG